MKWFFTIMTVVCAGFGIVPAVLTSDENMMRFYIFFTLLWGVTAFFSWKKEKSKKKKTPENDETPEKDAEDASAITDDKSDKNVTM